MLAFLKELQTISNGYPLFGIIFLCGQSSYLFGSHCKTAFQLPVGGQVVSITSFVHYITSVLFLPSLAETLLFTWLFVPLPQESLEPDCAFLAGTLHR